MYHVHRVLPLVIMMLIAALLNQSLTLAQPGVMPDLSGNSGAFDAAIDFRPDGSFRLALSGPGTNDIVILDDSLQEIGRLVTNVGRAIGLDWSPDGRFLAATIRTGDQQFVQVWDTETVPFSLYRQRQGLLGLSGNLQWSPDSSLLAVAEGADIRLWDVTADAITLTLVGGTRLVADIAWKPDSTQIADVDEFGTLRLWDLNSPNIVIDPVLGPLLDPFLQEEGGPTGTKFYTNLEWEPGGNLIAVYDGDNEVIDFWDSTTQTISFTLPESGQSQTNRLVWGTGAFASYITFKDTHLINIWDLVRGEVIGTITPVVPDTVLGIIGLVEWSPDGEQLLYVTSTETGIQDVLTVIVLPIANARPDWTLTDSDGDGATDTD